nr:HipA N-terminal domain-containing protein [Synechococcus sp. CB0205]
MAELQVWLNDQWVGLLALEAGALRFRYQPDWLQQTKAVPLSQTLPLQAAWMEDAQCRPFFAGLLPEGQLRRLIAQRFQISGENDFGLLEAIGGDCAGAISLQPANTDAEADQSAGVEWLDDSALSAVLGELPQRPIARRSGWSAIVARRSSGQAAGGGRGRTHRPPQRTTAEHPYPQARDCSGERQRAQRSVLHGLDPGHGHERCGH